MVTTSPTRTGRSKRMIRPEMKLAKISCKPKPNPKLMAATSHWTFDQPMPNDAATEQQADDGDHVAADRGHGVAGAGVEGQVLQHGHFQQAGDVLGGDHRRGQDDRGQAAGRPA